MYERVQGPNFPKLMDLFKTSFNLGKFELRVLECTKYQSVQSTRVYRVPDRVPECTEYQSVTVDSFRLYPRVPVKNQIQNRIWRKSEQQVEIIHSQSFK